MGIVPVRRFVLNSICAAGPKLFMSVNISHCASFQITPFHLLSQIILRLSFQTAFFHPKRGQPGYLFPLLQRPIRNIKPSSTVKRHCAPGLPHYVFCGKSPACCWFNYLFPDTSVFYPCDVRRSYHLDTSLMSIRFLSNNLMLNPQAAGLPSPWYSSCNP